MTEGKGAPPAQTPLKLSQYLGVSGCPNGRGRIADKSQHVVRRLSISFSVGNCQRRCVLPPGEKVMVLSIGGCWSAAQASSSGISVC